jgi:hypothetical protein
VRTLVCLVCVCLVAAVSTAARSLSVTRLGNFACYKTAFTEFATRKIRVKDQFGARVAIVGRPTELCSPAALNGRRIVDTVAHLSCHPAKLPGRASGRIVVSTQQFGVLNASIARATELCMPSSTARGGVLRPTPKTLDPFVCYAIVPLARFLSRGATVADEWQKSRDTVLIASSLCLPATVGTSRPRQTMLLACYTLKSDARGSGLAVVRSRLALLQASVGARDRLCTPSTKLP